MRRVVRLLAAAACALSPVCFVAVVAVWSRGAVVRDVIARERVWPSGSKYRGEVWAVGACGQGIQDLGEMVRVRRAAVSRR
jgi:hypothetical protein